MLPPIKLASPEQVQQLFDAQTADLDSNCQVFSLDKNLVVLRSAIELDPLVMEEKASTRERALFIWGVENHLRLTGAKAYYFNVHTADEEWIETVKHWGAIQRSTVPEFRFKKYL